MSKENIYNKLMVEIKNPYGVCGLMGNISAESGLLSGNAQNSCMNRMGITDEQYTMSVDNGDYKAFCTDRVGYGLCQWTSSGRKTGLLNYAKNTNRSISDEDMQIEYLFIELRTSYKNVLNVLMNATSVKEASDVVVTEFERPADQSKGALEKRQLKGEAIYKEFVKEDNVVENVIIAIDAGHGMKTFGKRCLKKIDKNETREWWLNDRIADRLEVLLSDYNCKIIRVDDTTGAKDISLATRVKTANNANADMYVSIHHNAGAKGSSSGGTVVFYYSSKEERLVQTKSLYTAITSRTKLFGNRSEKVKKKGFYVVKHTKMPAFLIENGFMDSSIDTPIILTAKHAEETAQGILKFLVSELRLTKKVVDKVEDTKTEVITPTVNTYKVIKGDTLSKIGKKLGIEWKEIASLNGIKAPYTLKVNQVLKLPGGVKESTVYYPTYTGKKTTLTGALTSLNITSTYAFRKEIAKANNISGYIGSANQNTQMYNLLVAGLLKRV